MYHIYSEPPEARVNAGNLDVKRVNCSIQSFVCHTAFRRLLPSPESQSRPNGTIFHNLRKKIPNGHLKVEH